MNKESVDCRRIKVPLAAGETTRPGDFAWEDYEDENCRYLYVHLPGWDCWSPIKVHRGAPLGNRIWGWDGNEDKPTVTPSIHDIRVWHGHLIAGRLVSCP